MKCVPVSLEKLLKLLFFVQKREDFLAPYAPLTTFGYILPPFRSLSSLSLHNKTRKVVNTRHDMLSKCATNCC
jgi:hypothetical protein